MNKQEFYALREKLLTRENSHGIAHAVKMLEENQEFESNRRTLEFLRRVIAQGMNFEDEFAYAFVAHTYDKNCSMVNSLIISDDLSWAHIFIDSRIEVEGSIYEFLRDELNANLVVIEDSDEILYKVPYKRQFIVEYFQKLGKKWLIASDDYFRWHFAYKSDGFKSPTSFKVPTVDALLMLQQFAKESSLPSVCPGSNFRRLLLTRSDEIFMVARAPQFWNVFIHDLEYLKENNIEFVTDRDLHEDICFSLAVAKHTSSLVPLFLYYVGTYDFKNEKLVAREPATDEYGGEFFKTTTKVQNGIPTKFYSINKRALEHMHRRKLF